jgi:vacuolar-type H+-ATPase catalytic subunit A/Vma1
MNITHKQLAAGRWRELNFAEQMANIGSEIERTISWKKKGNEAYSRLAFERALELIDFTLIDEKSKPRLKEILRVRESLADYFVFENSYHSTDESWQKYFYFFTYAARAHRKGNLNIEQGRANLCNRS